MTRQGVLAVVVGASGGIGRALIDHLEVQARFSRTIGLGRGTSRALDLIDESTIAHAAEHIRQFGSDVWLVIDATGFCMTTSPCPKQAGGMSMRHSWPTHSR